MNNLNILLITAATVGKVMLCAIIGLIVSSYFTHKQHTTKGFTFIAVRVLFPLLLFSNLCMSVTWSSIRMYYWALIIAFFPIFVGLAGAWSSKFYFNRVYTGMLILSCTFQNGLTYPVSLLISLKGVDWFGAEELETALAHIFLYNIVSTIGLWAVGEPIIKHFKSVEVAKEELAESRRLYEQEHAEREEELGDCRQTKISLRDEASTSQISGINGEAESTVVAGPSALDFAALMPIAWEAVKSPTVSGSLLGLTFSLVPPLRWIAETLIGQVFISAFALVGSGAIPLQLLVLGATVAGDPIEEPAGMEELAAPLSSNNEPESWVEKLKSQQSVFVICSIGIRLIIVPTVCFLLIHILRVLHIIPDEKVFLLTMLIGVCSPSAINSSIICVIHDYHPREYAHMIFIMYLTAIFFTTMWLFIFIIYLG